MTKKIVITLIALLLLVVAFTFYASNKDKNEMTAREEAVNNDERPEMNLITKHQYKDGEHAFIATLELPTPCHSFNAEVVDGDNPTINFTVSEPEEGRVCAQVITPKDAKVTYQGDENLEFNATVNGDPVNLLLYEIPADEDIDTAELFIKG